MSTVDDNSEPRDASLEGERVLPRELLESDRCPGPADRPYDRTRRLIKYHRRIKGEAFVGFRVRFDHPEARSGEQLEISKEHFIADVEHDGR